MSTPKTGAPEWSSEQASPWLQHNKALRVFDAFCFRTSIVDRDLTAPPGVCDDGDRYLVDTGATGAWAGKDGMLAIAAGSNAANGWIFCVVANDGNQIWIEDEAIQIEFQNGVWIPSPDRIPYDPTGIADGFTLYWDASNGVFYPGPAASAPSTAKVELLIACSDETTAITTGTGKVTFRMPHPMTLTEVRASATTAPTGSTIVIDINEAGVSILSTKLSIDASEKTSTTAATPAVISDASLADDAEMTIDFDQVGSTIAGAGIKVTLIGTRPI